MVHMNHGHLLVAIATHLPMRLDTIAKNRFKTNTGDY